MVGELLHQRRPGRRAGAARDRLHRRDRQDRAPQPGRAHRRRHARHRRRGRAAGAAQAARGARDLRAAQRDPALEQARLRGRRHPGHPVHRRRDVLGPAAHRASKPVGFGAGGGPAARAKSRRVTEKELLDYGLLAEFLGRMPVRVELDPLSEDDLFLVMTGPPDAVVREYQALLKMDGVDLQFTDGALRAGRAALHPAPARARAACARSSRRSATTSCSTRPSARGRPITPRRRLRRRAPGATDRPRDHEDLRALRRPGPQALLVRVLPAQDRRRRSWRSSAPSASSPSCSRRSSR